MTTTPRTGVPATLGIAQVQDALNAAHDDYAVRSMDHEACRAALTAITEVARRLGVASTRLGVAADTTGPLRREAADRSAFLAALELLNDTILAGLTAADDTGTTWADNRATLTAAVTEALNILNPLDPADADTIQEATHAPRYPARPDVT